MEVKHKLYIIYAISFMDLFAIGIMFPLLAPYVRELGASHFTIGLLSSSYSALQVLTGPLIGSWSDIRGRKFVLTITLSICTICYFLLAFTSSIFVIFVLRAILGFNKHTQTICKAFIADLLPVEEQAKAYGQSTGLGILGFVIGPVLGGHISQLRNGFFYICCITSLLFLINIALTYFMPSVQKKKETVANIDVISLLTMIHTEFLRTIKELIKIDWKTYKDMFLIRFLFAVSLSIFHSSHSLYLMEKYNVSQLYIGYTISFFSIIGVISSFSMGKITATFYKNDYNGLQRIYHSFCTMAVCCIGFYFAPGILTYYTFLIPFAITSTILRIVTMEAIISKSKDEKGSLSGASNSIMSIARFLTPLVSGIIADIFSENVVMLSGFVPTICGSLLCIYLMNMTRLKSE